MHRSRRKLRFLGFALLPGCDVPELDVPPQSALDGLGLQKDEETRLPRKLIRHLRAAARYLLQERLMHAAIILRIYDRAISPTYYHQKELRRGYDRTLIA